MGPRDLSDIFLLNWLDLVRSAAWAPPNLPLFKGLPSAPMNASTVTSAPAVGADPWLPPLHEIHRVVYPFSPNPPDLPPPDNTPGGPWIFDSSMTPAFSMAAPPYAGAADANDHLASPPNADIVDPARTRRLLEDARRAHDFVKWAFGPPSVRPEQQMRYAAAEVAAPRPSVPTAGMDDAGDVPAPILATESVPAPPTNWGERWNTAVGNPDTGTGLQSAAQPPGLAAATGNPNIERQGARARATAAMREPITFPHRVADRVTENFRDAFETPLGPGPEYRAAASPFIVSPSGRINPFNRALLIDLPELVDAAGRALAASYYSGIDTGTEGLVSLGVSRSTSESLGRDLKAIPEAFAGSPTVARRMIPPSPLQLTGQIHHAISKRVFRELENHVNLRGSYTYRDPRFETQAVDLPAHNGYWGWHEDLDDEVENYIRAHRELTPATFETYLHRRYAQPDLKARFPNGFRRR